MNRFWIPLVIFALLCVVFGVALQRAPEKRFVKSALLGKPAPEFVLPDLLKPGSTVDSRQFRGRWVLINVWGTWCFECRAEHEQLLAIQRTGKVALVGLNYKDNDDAARSWLADAMSNSAASPSAPSKARSARCTDSAEASGASHNARSLRRSSPVARR